MTPMALIDILDEDLQGANLNAASITEVAVLILGAGLFSFLLIFSEVSSRSGILCSSRRTALLLRR